MRVFLGLGSNVGNRKAHLSYAISHLKNKSQSDRPFKISPIYETPALLPPNSEPEWNKPFLNLVIECHFTLSIENLLELARTLELECGRKPRAKWAPRELDIDILWCEGITHDSEQLTLPHPEILNRAFVLDPLKDLCPSLQLSSGIDVRALAIRHPEPQPLIMGIINLTPDSFSDGGINSTPKKFSEQLRTMADQCVPLIDIGAESTRPSATPISAAEELYRLEPFFEITKSLQKERPLHSKLSLDTRNATSAALALQNGFSIINDVSAGGDRDMAGLIAEHECDYIFMHNLGIPADRARTLPPDVDVIDHIKWWADKKISDFVSKGINRDRLIFDPGLGFGKSAAQSIEILNRINEFEDLGLRILIGHSRKSFMTTFTQKEFRCRDSETLAISLKLASKGVDILRVHEAVLHKHAFMAWAHIK